MKHLLTGLVVVLAIAACDRPPSAPPPARVDTLIVTRHDTTITIITRVDTILVKTPRGVDTVFVPVHDTTVVVKHDTTVVPSPPLPPQIDTILVPVIRVDTVSTRDTVVHTDTIVRHDTTIVVVHDTVIVKVPQPAPPPRVDTLYIPVHDTTIVYVPVHPPQDTSGLVVVPSVDQDHFLVFYHGELMGMVLNMGTGQGWRGLKYHKGEPTLQLLDYMGGDFLTLDAAVQGLTFGWIELRFGPIETPIATSRSSLFLPTAPTASKLAPKGRSAILGADALASQNVKLTVGQKVKIFPTVKDANGVVLHGQTVTLRSLNPAVATVTETIVTP